MRLSKKEVQTLTSAFASCLAGIEYTLYLFGSRIDDLKKGGDIDLLCVVSSEEKENVINMKSRIRRDMFRIIPEQKIDITVATKEELKTDEFLQSVLNQAVILDSRR